jgi:hypothetical protein
MLPRLRLRNTPNERAGNLLESEVCEAHNVSSVIDFGGKGCLLLYNRLAAPEAMDSPGRFTVY